MKAALRSAHRGRRLRLCMAVAACLFAGTASGMASERDMKTEKDYLHVRVSGRAECGTRTVDDAKGQTRSFDIRLFENHECRAWVDARSFSRRKTTISFLQKNFSLFQKKVSSDHPAGTLDLIAQCGSADDGNVSPEDAGRLRNEYSRNEPLRLSKALRAFFSRLPLWGKPAHRNRATASPHHASFS